MLTCVSNLANPPCFFCLAMPLLSFFLCIFHSDFTLEVVYFLEQVDLQKRIEQTEEGARMMIVDETESAGLVEADLDRMRQYQAELQNR